MSAKNPNDPCSVLLRTVTPSRPLACSASVGASILLPWSISALKPCAPATRRMPVPAFVPIATTPYAWKLIAAVAAPPLTAMPSPPEAGASARRFCTEPLVMK